MSNQFPLCFHIILSIGLLSTVTIQKPAQVSSKALPLTSSSNLPASLTKSVHPNSKETASPTGHSRKHSKGTTNQPVVHPYGPGNVYYTLSPGGLLVPHHLPSGEHLSQSGTKTYDRQRKPPDPPVKYCDPSRQGDVSKLGTFPTTNIDPYVLSTYKGATKHIENLSCKTSPYDKFFNDPLWKAQWYMHDYRTANGPVMDHNLMPVYRMGYTGAGVHISIVDDGVIKHPDLILNYLVDDSYDYKRLSRNAEPTVFDKDNIHGTSVASIIAMAANNNLCGVGMAYNTKFASVKPSGTDSILPLREAQALVHGVKTVKIINNSRGPRDDGMYAEHLSTFLLKALEIGFSKGRDGLGIIYPFPSGNGKHNDDHCSYDAVVNHPFTITISSASQYGKSPYYSEGCSAVFAATYSGGERNEERMVTADVDGTCAKRFTGTSASVPIATSIFALMLEANPYLSARDVMHIITMGAEVAPLADNPDTWYQNGAGFWVSNAFGFGLLNAENMVNLALHWQSVAQEFHCKSSTSTSEYQPLTVRSPVTMEISTYCQNTVNWIEQVELVASVIYPFRGAITIDITSPAGTNTRIMDKRVRDSYQGGLSMWSMKSTHNWGEHATGTWTVLITVNRIAGIPAGSGQVVKLDLFIHGLKKPPPHQSFLPRRYAPFRTTYGQTSV